MVIVPVPSVRCPSIVPPGVETVVVLTSSSSSSPVVPTVAVTSTVVPGCGPLSRADDVVREPRWIAMTAPPAETVQRVADFASRRPRKCTFRVRPRICTFEAR